MASSECVRFIPEEILEDILFRLPENSLSRFRCVSKHWCTTITLFNPKFSPSNRTKGIAFLRDLWESNHAFVPNYCLGVVEDREGGLTKYIIDDDVSTHLLATAYPPSRIEVHRSAQLLLLASYRGLLLIRWAEYVYLLNPLTRRCRKVINYKYDSNAQCNVAGICYDSSSEDYKILFGFRSNYNDFKFEVVSLKTGRLKRIEAPNNYDWLLVQQNGPVLDEKIHWWVWRKQRSTRYECWSRPRNNSNVVIYFDGRINKLMELQMPRHPKFIEEFTYVMLGLGVFEGCVAMTWSDGRSREGSVVDVWVMKEYGVQESWTVLHTIGVDPSNVARSVWEASLWAPLMVTKDGRVLIQVGFGRIVAYDPKDESCKDILVLGREQHKFGFSIIVYEESLFFPPSYSLQSNNLDEANGESSSTGGAMAAFVDRLLKKVEFRPTL